jgi:flavodoxin I
MVPFMPFRPELIGCRLRQSLGVAAVAVADCHSFRDRYPEIPYDGAQNLLYRTLRFRDRGENVKVLVSCMSSTGNTKKIAEAIYGEITADKEIKPVSEVESLAGYDLAFLGFPTHGYGPDKKAKAVLENLCKDKKKVALFVTHAAPESEPEVAQYMAKFEQAAAGAEIVGTFSCQGQLSSGVKFIMKISPNKKMRSDARSDNSKGQPDANRIEMAKAFSREVMGRLSA